jgi:hypothetical protein
VTINRLVGLVKGKVKLPDLGKLKNKEQRIKGLRIKGKEDMVA